MCVLTNFKFCEHKGLCVCAYMPCIHVSTGPHTLQKRSCDAVDLESQESVGHWIWGLGRELCKSSGHSYH